MTYQIPQGFADLGLPEPLLKAIADLGYENPSPIQTQAIPVILKGTDILGQAQTGTGKTGAFALPLLANMNPAVDQPQVLVLTPTRELALQVAEAFAQYAKYLPHFQVLPIYGGQSYGTQIRLLKRAAQVVVATPGRLMDLMEKGNVDFSALQAVVLDEADEMLRMGFIDDVDWILSNTPDNVQVALFSATMPPEIKRVANSHLTNPEHIQIQSKTTTNANIRQRYWMVRGLNKLDALTRMLEVEPTDGVIIFVRTKSATEELAQHLKARGYQAEALNGDLQQQAREKVVDRIKSGHIDIVIATDVAARGIDVPRISHVVNYDIPQDPESYTHRIGRTGRAGRQGEAILFVAPREQRMLGLIERVTRQRMEPMDMPSIAEVNSTRVSRFKTQLSKVIETETLDAYEQMVMEFCHDEEVAPEKAAAALMHLFQGGKSLVMDEKTESRASAAAPSRGKIPVKNQAKPLKDFPDMATERYILQVGRSHGAKVGNIVGCIANEGNLESRYIGEIEIYPTVTTIDLPADMLPSTLDTLAKARIAGRKTEIAKMDPSKDYFCEDAPEPEGDDRFARKPRREGGYDRDRQGGRGHDRGDRPGRGFRQDGERSGGYRHEQDRSASYPNEDARPRRESPFDKADRPKKFDDSGKPQRKTLGLDKSKKPKKF